MAGKFCLCSGNGANKRPVGTKERAEPRPIRDDDFLCLRESAENTKTCQSNTDDSGLFIQNTSQPHTLNS